MITLTDSNPEQLFYQKYIRSFTTRKADTVSNKIIISMVARYFGEVINSYTHNNS